MPLIEMQPIQLHQPVAPLQSYAGVEYHSGPISTSPEQPETWASRQIHNLLNLDDDWDSYGSIRPDRALLWSANLLLQQIEKLKPARWPCVGGSSDGGIVIDWMGDDVQLILEFVPADESEPATATVYVKTPTNEVEGLLGDYIDEASKAVQLLAS